ncbi:hypothetical protein RFI_06472 [Reticulomyxa filosa]|uniref:Uncharacterized protein n=1 Tax=Reticulomyxa filosa TaxID=46433 RepID=X6NXN8_RETFI|nr:hypothetical protein RFI_06472 [Reticulomyxa filosa]|eukprot:ETO30648.1 hypothetical protein RFI_06472 [Reticulomyxa filosa]
MIAQTKEEGERENENDLINGPVTKPSAPLLSELRPISEQKEPAQVPPELPRLSNVDVINCVKCILGEVDSDRLSKWRADLRKQDIYNLYDVLMLEPESLPLLSSHVTVNCYNCIIKLRMKCSFLVVYVNKPSMGETMNFEKMNGVYVHLPGQDMYEGMPLFRQIVIDAGRLWPYCVLNKGKKWKLTVDSPEGREKQPWMISDDDILNRAKKSKWTYYSTQDKAFKAYENKQFSDIIVNFIQNK